MTLSRRTSKLGQRKKDAALIYLDDRAVRFDGANFPTTQQIHQLKPWNKR